MLRKLFDIAVAIIMFPVFFLFYVNKSVLFFVIGYVRGLFKIADGTL